VESRLSDARHRHPAVAAAVPAGRGGGGGGPTLVFSLVAESLVTGIGCVATDFTGNGVPSGGVAALVGLNDLRWRRLGSATVGSGIVCCSTTGFTVGEPAGGVAVVEGFTSGEPEEGVAALVGLTTGRPAGVLRGSSA